MLKIKDGKHAKSSSSFSDAELESTVESSGVDTGDTEISLTISRNMCFKLHFLIITLNRIHSSFKHEHVSILTASQLFFKTYPFDDRGDSKRFHHWVVFVLYLLL